jgi:predicted RNA binding protein YcfA (HicA-like mRNA interferase family)
VKLPRVSGKQTVDAFLKANYFVHHIHGSHYVLKHRETGIRIVIPYHRQTLAPRTLSAILKQAGISQEQFISLL